MLTAEFIEACKNALEATEGADGPRQRLSAGWAHLLNVPPLSRPTGELGEEFHTLRLGIMGDPPRDPFTVIDEMSDEEAALRCRALLSFLSKPEFE